MIQEVRVFAPASVANVAVGYDILGFAIEKPGDEIVARFSDTPGLRIVSITGDNGRLPYEVEKNTAGYAAQRLLAQWGKAELGIELEIHKKMPFGSGLGSSAASAAGAVMAIKSLLGSSATKMQCMRAAVEGEQKADGAFHADNVAPSLLGGFTLIRSNKALDIISLPVPNDLCAAVIYPKVEVLTKSARDILSPQLSLTTCIAQTGNLAAFISSLYTGDFELMARSLQDVWIEPQRASLIPYFKEVQEAAKANHALGCSISGAGPSIFALCRGISQAEKCIEPMRAIFQKAGIPHQTYVSAINQTGATLINKTN
ncbi:MAG: homoserine kinase [Saprospiraceae bacterium]|nr:homoserine kinase [Saprospiraceae bacterium]